MKLPFILALIIITLITAAFFIDQTNKSAIYKFCSSHSIGNNIKEVEISAQQTDFLLDKSEKDTLLVFKSALQPWKSGFTCEIKYQDGKVTHLYFIIE